MNWKNSILEEYNAIKLEGKERRIDNNPDITKIPRLLHRYKKTVPNKGNRFLITIG